MRDDDNHEGQGPDRDYEVGYGRPPTHTQFRPGKSGNPKGRHRKPQSVQAQMEKVLSAKVTINEGGRAKKLSLQQVILRNLANKAAKGDLKAAAFVFNLRHAPEFADADVIDQDKLSADDQLMLEQVMRQFAQPECEDESITSDPATDEDRLVVPSPPLETTDPETNNPIPEDPTNDD